MKAYVIVLETDPRAIRAYEYVKLKMSLCYPEIELIRFEATTPQTRKYNFKARQLLTETEKAVIESHYNVWKCIDEPTLILEHDAAPINRSYDIVELASEEFDVIELSHPVWAPPAYNDGSPFEYYKKNDGLVRRDGKWKCLLGAGAYIMSKNGATKMMKEIETNGAFSLDVSIRQPVVEIYDLLPAFFMQSFENYSTVEHTKYNNIPIEIMQ